MVSASTLLKKFANVNHSVIDSYEFTQNLNGEDILKIYLHPYKTYANRCPVCGRRCKVYDRSKCDHLKNRDEAIDRYLKEIGDDGEY